MSRTWRPGGWKNANIDFTHLKQWEIYELGATAMLEALFKLAEQSPTGTFVIDSRDSRNNYTLHKDEVNEIRL